MGQNPKQPERGRCECRRPGVRCSQGYDLQRSIVGRKMRTMAAADEARRRSEETAAAGHDDRNKRGQRHALTSVPGNAPRKQSLNERAGNTVADSAYDEEGLPHSRRQNLQRNGQGYHRRTEEKVVQAVQRTSCWTKLMLAAAWNAVCSQRQTSLLLTRAVRQNCR